MIGQKNVRSFVKGILFLSPAIVLLLIFMVYPIFRTMDMSFYTSYNYFKDEVYERGLGNYRYLLEDQEFQTALKNTVVYVLGVMPASILLSLLLAILLNSKIRFKALFQTIYFLPFVTSTVAIAIVWRWIYNSEYGILNSVLKLFGVDPIKWLLDPHWTMLSLIILGIWKSLGFNIIVFLAGLQNIDEQYDKAARIDGATTFQRVRRVTLPLLSPTIFFVCIITLINSFKAFDQVYALFSKSAGPLNSCLTMVYYIYEKFYNQFNYGVASAAVVVLYVIILVLNFIQFRIGKYKVHY